MTAKTAEVVKGKTEEDKPDLEVIMPEEKQLEICGIPCYVKRVKTREFFALLGVITTGMGGNLGQLNFDTENQDEFGAQLLAALFVALPNAVDPFVRLVRDLVRADDDKFAVQLRDYLDNPDLDDLMEIADVVVMQEQNTIWSLVGKARAYAAKWKTTVNGSRGRGPGSST